MSDPFNPSSFRTRPVRILNAADGTPRFVARDVAEVLEVRCPDADWLSAIPAEWQSTCPVRTLGGFQLLRVLTEEGVYFLLTQSPQPRARGFRRWLAGELLPAIRHRGVYRVPHSAAV